MKAKVAIGVTVTVLLLAAVGLLAYGFIFSPASDDAVNLVPENAIGYFNVFLSPSNSQKQALEDLIAKTPFDSPEEAIDRLTSLTNEGLKEQGCTFEEDIEPWLGSQVAGFLTEVGDEGQGAVLVGTEDGDAAIASIRKCGEDDFEDAEERSYEGVDYFFYDDGAVGIVDGYLVIATEGAFEDVVDTSAGGNALVDSDKFQSALEPLTSDRLALFYLDLESLFEQLQETGEADPEEMAAFESVYGGALDQPLSAGLFARSDAIVFEYASGIPTGEGAEDVTSAFTGAVSSDLLGRLPGGSWGAFAIGSFGEYVDGLLDLVGRTTPGGRAFFETQFARTTGLSLTDDVLGWMGDLGIFVQGTSTATLSGGLVIETDDEAASVAAVEALERFARQDDAPVKELSLPGAEGFTIQDPFQPQPINVAVGNGRVVIAYGDLATEQALEGEVTLEQESDVFADAADTLGEEFTMSGFFEADAIQTLVEDEVLPTLTTYDPASGQYLPNTEAQDRYEEDVKPFVDPLSFLAFGSRVEEDTATARWVIGVE